MGRKKRVPSLQELKAQAEEIQNAIQEREEEMQMLLGKSVHNWIQKRPYLDQSDDSDVMADIYRVYENVHWIFNDHFSHSSTTLKAFERLEDNQYKVILSNGSSFAVEATNGQELLEKIASHWNLLVKAGQA
jgi:hypothetical protein